VVVMLVQGIELGVMERGCGSMMETVRRVFVWETSSL
jgi:hypothetical protein